MGKLKNYARASRRCISILLILFVPVLQNIGVSVARAELVCGPEENWTFCFLEPRAIETPVIYSRGKSADKRSALFYNACSNGKQYIYLSFRPTEFNPSVPDDMVSRGVMEVRVDRKPIKRYKFQTIISTDKTKVDIHLVSFKDMKLITSSMMTGKKISFKIPEVSGFIEPIFSINGFPKHAATFKEYGCPLK